MGNIYYTKFEDAVVMKHLDTKGTPDVAAIQAELKANGYDRSESSIRTHVSVMRSKGKIIKSGYTRKPKSYVT